jgi:outer membrane protein assembly factor BamD (BamD/ComL family)
MSISAVSSSSGVSQAFWQTSVNPQKQTFHQLSKALKSGDLAGAKEAFASLQQNAAGGQSSAVSITNDFASLQKDLDSGDLDGAKSAFSQLKTDLQSAARSTHSHYGVIKSHQHGSPPDGSSPAPQVNGTSTGTTDKDTGTTLNTYA